MRTLLTMLTVAVAFAGLALAAPSAPSAPASNPPAPASNVPDGGRTVLEAPADEVTVTIRSSPRAAVRWGGTALGDTPLVLKRPRESGPMDLTLNAGGYLPLHVRAYTFTDDTLNVRLVPISQASTVFGYPASLDGPEVPVGAEGTQPEGRVPDPAPPASEEPPPEPH